MRTLTRRRFVALAAALGASPAFAQSQPQPSTTSWREKREAYPEGVASGDPQPDSVMLWTRHPGSGNAEIRLTVEIAEDPQFQRVVANTTTPVSAETDWTCRILVSGLTASREYWYRFTDPDGNGSRLGRTLTAPAPGDSRAVRFAFVSCQNVTQGAQNAWRKMIYEDEKALEKERLGFVLHLGDFIYEVVWYPEDRPQGMYDRKLRDLVRYPQGQKVADFHIPTTLADYRTAYRAYLHDPDLQDARARFPFVSMWDNHEFSWLGWQSIQIFKGENVPAQTRKVAANQAWFEYHPARVRQPHSRSHEKFDAPQVKDAPVTKFDDAGLGQELNNLAAIQSLAGHRVLRYGQNVDLLITDQHSYRSEEPTLRPEAEAFSDKDFPDLFPEEAMQILDAGRTFNVGKPPEKIAFGAKSVPNFQRNKPAQTILGAEQKTWFLGKLKDSQTTWKIWGNSLGTLDTRADPQNLPPEAGKRWPGNGYAGFGGGDYGAAYVERAEIYDFVKKAGITGFVTVSGDRHSFWAGFNAKTLPPQPFDPVGVAFVTGSISAPGLVESLEHNLPKDLELRALYLAEPPGAKGPQPAVNLLLKHGVRTCLEYQKSGDLAKARALSNPDLAPHLKFVDMGGHGYAVLKVTRRAVEAEFVCIPRPIERAETPDGGPLRYRVVHRVEMWTAGSKPVMEQKILEGDPGLAT